MNPTTPHEFGFAIQNSIESTMHLIALNHGNELKFDWTFTLNTACPTGIDGSVFLDCDLTKSHQGRHLLERFRNALNAFGYDFTVLGSERAGVDKCHLSIRVSAEIKQDGDDAEYADFCEREEKQLQKSGRIY